MAASQQGYQCEFIGSVSEDLYCKKCALVARRLTVAMCCGESFCHDCLVDSRQQDKSCPACGVKNFTTFEQIKLQKKINCLQVYCSVKEKGCGWSGALEQLDAHLDPDLDNCQYVDIKCPLNCPMAVPKNKVNEHLIKECVKRAFTCQYCNFKGTYEEVVDTHLTECNYVPLQCPNMCGVTCEREVMEDHMKICRLEDVACEFKGMGCDDQFPRENKEEHARQKLQKHIALTASVALETKQHLQQTIDELERKIEKQLNQDLKHNEVEEKLKDLVTEQDKKLKEQEKMIQQQQKELTEQENEQKVEERKLKNVIEENMLLKLELDKHKRFLEQQNSRILKLEKLLQEHVDKCVQHEGKLSEISTTVGLDRHFKIENFSHVRAKGNSWKSPAMYTHLYGYKFCVEVKPNAFDYKGAECMEVNLILQVGEFDDQLKWPATIAVTMKLVNQHGGKNAKFSTQQWHVERPRGASYNSGQVLTVEHAKLNQFLKNDTLFFQISEFKALQV